MRDILTKIIPDKTRTLVAPPGHILESEGKSILIPSLMRSGTHLLIDLILNNFSQYKRKPLYIDLDQYLMANRPACHLYNCGNYIFKTHFPQIRHTENNKKIIKKLITDSFLISPLRNIDDVYRSSVNFTVYTNRKDFHRDVNTFNNFWKDYNICHILFTDLIDTNKTTILLDRISAYINVPRNKKVIYPPPKRSLFYVLFLKLITRLIGHYSPVVNTTIGFARTDHSK